MNLRAEIQAIEKILTSATSKASDMTSALEQLNQLKIKTTNPQEVAEVERLISVTKDLRKERGDAAEQERRSLETMGVQNKAIIALVEKLRDKHKLLANAVLQSAVAYGALVKNADIGKAIAHVGAITPLTKTFGAVLGFAANAAIKAQDRVQAVNKSIIDLSASTGHFGQGMESANKATLAITTGFAVYAQQTGIASDKLQQLAGDLGKVGFTMEEMGIDKQTGRISTLSSAIGGNSKQWGTLSVALGVARATGLGQGEVVSQLQTQIKTLGGTVEGTVKTFGALSIAANRSRLSTSTLLPVVRSMQESFKMLGLDSVKAAEMLGKAGEVAEKSGVGVGTAVEVMGKAISGMANMDFGKMAFMGQQMGMGGGLSAGFQFRKQAGGEGGAGMAQQIGQVVGKLMGGTGELISEEQAIGNEQLASIRLGQENLAQQMLGLSANESRVFINMTKELEGLNASGQGDSDKAKDLNKEINKMSMSENAYRAKTLTGQEKVQNLLQLISALVGRAVSIFVRAFAGGAASSTNFGKDINSLLSDIGKGEGLDNITDRIAGISDTFEKTMGPAIETMGGFMGKHWLATIATVFGGSFIFDTRKLIGAGIKGLFAGGADGEASIASKAFSTGLKLLGSTLRGGITAFKALPSGANGLASMFRILQGAGGGAIRSLSGISPIFGGIAKGASMLPGLLGKLALGLGPAGIALIALGAAAVGFSKWYFGGMEEVAKQRLKSEEQVTAAQNKYLTILNKTNDALEKKSSLNSFEALQLVNKIRNNDKLQQAEQKVWDERREIILKQAINEASKQKTLAVGAGAKPEVIKAADEAQRFAEEALRVFRTNKYGSAGASQKQREDRAQMYPALGTPLPANLAPGQSGYAAKWMKGDKELAQTREEAKASSDIVSKISRLSTSWGLATGKDRDRIEASVASLYKDLDDLAADAWKTRGDQATKMGAKPTETQQTGTQQTDMDKQLGNLGAVAKQRVKDEEQISKSTNSLASSLNKTDSAMVKLTHTTEENERISKIMQQKADIIDDSYGASPKKKKELEELQRELSKELDTIQNKALRRQPSGVDRSANRPALGTPLPANLAPGQSGYAAKWMKGDKELAQTREEAKVSRDIADKISRLSTSRVFSSSEKDSNRIEGQMNSLYKSLDDLAADAWKTRGDQATQVIGDKDKRKAAEAEAAKKTGAENKDTNVKVEISLKDEMLSARVEKGVRQAAEKDIVAPGKSGQSANRHGVSQGYQ